jgi:phage recombination protein Bet
MNELAIKQEDELIYTLQTSLYVGAKVESVRMVMAYCRAAGLDVMQKPVHIVPMWNTKAGQMIDVVMPGVGLYRTQASRTGEFAGMTEPEFGPMITETISGVQITYPEYARCTVKRALPSGVIAEFSAIEYWIENYAVKGGKEKSNAPNSMWAKRPRGQIAKCAQAQALRIAFPELGAAPTADEMEGKTLYQPEVDITPEAPNIQPKRKFSDSRIDDAIAAINAGEFSLKQIIDTHELTDDQLVKFNEALAVIEAE